MTTALQIMGVTIVITVVVAYLIGLLIHILGEIVNLAGRKMEAGGDDMETALAIAVALARRQSAAEEKGN